MERKTATEIMMQRRYTLEEIVEAWEEFTSPIFLVNGEEVKVKPTSIVPVDNLADVRTFYRRDFPAFLLRWKKRKEE